MASPLWTLLSYSALIQHSSLKIKNCILPELLTFPPKSLVAVATRGGLSLLPFKIQH